MKIALANKKVLFHLSLIPNVGPSTIFRLLKYAYVQQFPDMIHAGWHEIIQAADTLDFQRIYHYSASEFRFCGLDEKLCQSISASLADLSIIDRELDLVEKYDVRIVSVIDNRTYAT